MRRKLRPILVPNFGPSPKKVAAISLWRMSGVTLYCTRMFSIDIYGLHIKCSEIFLCNLCNGLHADYRILATASFVAVKMPFFVDAAFLME